MADDVEFGHVVDLTLGEPAGTELVADAAIGATSLLVDYAGDFEDTGEVVLNGEVIAYTAITYGELETDPDTIALSAPLAAAALTDDRVGIVSGGEPVVDWALHVSLGDGHPVEIPIPFEQRAIWSTVDVSTPVPVFVSADLERLVEVPGRTPVIDGASVDASTLDVTSLPPVPGGQTFSVDAPVATAGFPEDHGWWQVVDGEVVGFWRLVAGVWTTQDIVTQEALSVGNILADAINTVDLTGVTVTGATVRTAVTGERLVMRNDGGGGILETFSGLASESPGGLDPSLVDGTLPAIALAPGTTPSFPDGGRLTIYSGTTGGSSALVEAYNVILRAGAVGDIFPVGELALGQGEAKLTHPDITLGDATGSGTIDLNGSVSLNEITAGSVGTGSFRDSVDARVSAVAPTVTMTTGGVGTGAFRDSVDARVAALGTWTAYTPTFTASVTNPTLANFTVSGRYVQVGKTVNFVALITCNTAANMGSGNYQFGLPVAARATNEVVCIAQQSGPNHGYQGRGASTTTVNLFLTSTDAVATVTSTGMAAATSIRISGTYEAA